MNGRAKRAVLLTVALVAGSGTWACGDGGELYPFYEFDHDTDSDTETDTDGTPSTDEPPDSDTDPCPPDFVDEYGRCIRFVNWVSTSTVCGASWDYAYSNLQDAIDSAYESAQILGSCDVWVAKGIYPSYTGDPMDTVKMRKGVHIFGGFAAFETEIDQRDVAANTTILSGTDFLGTGNSYHVVQGADDATLDGFTITGGDAVGPAPHHRGGGMYINSASTAVRNCTFTHNRAVDGGAIFAYDGGATISASLFTENHAERGGAIYILNGAARVEEVTVELNMATIAGGGIYAESLFGACMPELDKVTVSRNLSLEDGGGLFNRNCDVTLLDSMIDENRALVDGGGLGAFRGRTQLFRTAVIGNTADGSGGGLLSDDNEMVLVDSELSFNSAAGDGGGAHLSWSEGAMVSCVVTGNAAGEDGGGLFTEMDVPSVVNTLVTGNTASRGGGFFNGPRGDPTIINCVLSGNQAAERGGALFNAELSEVDVANSIAWGDQPEEIYDEPGSTTLVRYCDVRGGYPGVNVIDEDPLFVSPGYWDDNGSPLDPTDDFWVQGDFHLGPESPCIDNADDAVSPIADADGNTWEDFVGVGMPSVAADVGAYDCKP